MALTLFTADLELTATNQTILTSPSASVISKAIACNNDTSARTVTIYKVPSGGSAGSGNEIVNGSGANAFTLSPGQTLPLPLSGLVMQVNDTLQGFASVTSVVNISVGYMVPS